MKTIIEYIRLIRIFYIRIKISLFARSLKLPLTTVIVAPHPDDEVLGCAGLIQKLIKEEKNVHVIYLTGGEGSHRGCCNISETTIIKERKILASNVAKMIKLPSENIHFLYYRDGEISLSHPMTEQLRKKIYQIKPNAIFIPHHREGWNDHTIVYSIVKEITNCYESISLYEYCVWFWYYQFWKIDWENACSIWMRKAEYEMKIKTIKNYLLPTASCGKPWSGVLPKVLVKACQWNNELFFKIK